MVINLVLDDEYRPKEVTVDGKKYVRRKAPDFFACQFCMLADFCEMIMRRCGAHDYYVGIENGKK